MTICTQGNRDVSFRKRLLPWIPYVVVLLVFAYYSFSVDITSGDTYFHPEEWQEEGLFHYTFVHLYQTWSGRWLLNLTLCLIGKQLYIWRIINLLATAGIVFALDYLAGLRTVWQRAVLAILILLYPYETMSTPAGPLPPRFTGGLYALCCSAWCLCAGVWRRRSSRGGRGYAFF